MSFWLNHVRKRTMGTIGLKNCQQLSKVCLLVAEKLINWCKASDTQPSVFAHGLSLSRPLPPLEIPHTSAMVTGPLPRCLAAKAGHFVAAIQPATYKGAAYMKFNISVFHPSAFQSSYSFFLHSFL